MPQKLLGLDIGTYSVKAALFEATFRVFELTDLFESTPLKADDLAPEDRATVTTEAILRLLGENKISPSTIVTAIPGHQVSTRILSFPLPEKQVEKVLPFELEPHLPFDIDEVIVSHCPVIMEPKRTLVLAAAVRKVILAEHLAVIRGAHIEPAFVGLDSLALFNLNQTTLASDPGTYAIVDIGHQKTSICIVSNHELRFVRTVLTAGRAMTEAVRTNLDLTSDQALDVKHEHGILEIEGNPLQSKDLRRLSTALRLAVDPLVRELAQTFQAYRAHYSNEGTQVSGVERVYLCGGGSLLRNFPEYIQSVTNHPVSRVEFFGKEHPVTKRLGHRQSVLAQSVGLGLRAAARGASAKRIATLSFRKGEFAFARDLSGLRTKAMFFGRWIAVIFAAACLHVGIRYENLSRQLEKMEMSVLKTFREIAPDVKKPPKNSTLALKALQEQIQKYRKQQEILTAGLNDLTALTVLREISERIPAEIPLDTQELSIDRNNVTLRGNTDSFSSVDKIISALSQFPSFRKIDKGDVRDSPDGKKSFQITVTVGVAPEEPRTEKERKKR